MKELISVIIPVYNAEKTLEKCLKSVLNQTYCDLEILIINDGSTDESEFICELYKQKDKRIKVLHKNNGGAASARNKGLDMSEGNFISFVDSDDWIEPDFIETLHKILIKNQLDISQVSLNVVINQKQTTVIRHKKIEVNTGKEMIKNLYKRETYIDTVTPCNKLYRENIFADLRFPEGMIYEDEAIIHEILYKCERIGVCKSKLYHYILRENSVMTSEYSIKRLDSIKAFERRIHFFEKNGEKELLLRTYPIYFRSLLGNLTKLKKSKINNKDEYMEEIENKIQKNINHFNHNKYFRVPDLILLKCTLVNLELGIIVNSLFNKLKSQLK